ncbi:MAG TPA: MBL fold metallo-hydrolase [Spirochaetia bacterium]|nr:MBL fold metallo-hydrolase [Spirochaetia bacterium]
MLPVIRLSLPTPYPVGPVNSYFINSKPYTLVDPGPNTEIAKKRLSAGLAEAGVKLEDIERIIITHAHSDHASLAGWVKSRTNAVIFAHPYEYRKLTGFNIWREVDPFLRAGGTPETVLDYLHNTVDPIPPMDLSPADISPLRGGERLPAGDGWLEVLHLPGHSVGHLGLFEPGQGDFFAGDFLLPDITPNPVMEPDPGNGGKRAESLRQYLASLDLVAPLRVRMVWPGHGDPFTDLAGVVARARKHHARRLDDIFSLVGDHWLTPYEITGLVYPKLSEFNVFLGFSEVMSHLDLLEQQGRLVRRENGGVLSYRHAQDERGQ